MCVCERDRQAEKERDRESWSERDRYIAEGGRKKGAKRRSGNEIDVKMGRNQREREREGGGGGT